MDSTASGHEAPASRWVGRIGLLSNSALVFGTPGRTDGHAHYAHQVMVAAWPSTTLRVMDGAGGQAQGGAFVIPGGATHAVLAASGEAWTVWLDPDQGPGRRLAALVRGKQSASAWAEAARPLVSPTSSWRSEECASIAAALVRPLLGTAAVAAPRHPVVARLLAAAPELLGQGADLGRAAALAGISPDRLRHVLRDELGTTWRSWVRWLRMRQAVAAISRGARLVEAAHGAGFSDAAHMSRTFRRMFGLAPSDALGLLEWTTGGGTGVVE